MSDKGNQWGFGLGSLGSQSGLTFSVWVSEACRKARKGGTFVILGDACIL